MKEINLVKEFKKKFSTKVNLKSLNLPVIFSQDKKNVLKALNEKEISTYGKYSKIFEKELSKYLKSKHVISLINGSSALQIAMLAAGINKKHEVLMPSFNYIAGANAVSKCGATPHFIDIEENTLGICPAKLEKYLLDNTVKINGLTVNQKTKRNIKAILILYTFGHPPKIQQIKKIAKKFNLMIIEDAAEALGSFYKGKHAGTFGDLGILSFNGNKIISTGGGGAIITKSNLIAKRVRKLTNNGKKNHRWKFIFDEKGFNYRLPSINASLGISQLKNLPKLIKRNRNLYLSYRFFFKKYKNIFLFKEPNNCKSNYWLQTIILDKKLVKIRNKIINQMINSGIEARAPWQLLSETKMYKNCPKMSLNISKNMFNRIINLPSRII